MVLGQCNKSLAVGEIHSFCASPTWRPLLCVWNLPSLLRARCFPPSILYHDHREERKKKTLREMHVEGCERETGKERGGREGVGEEKGR